MTKDGIRRAFLDRRAAMSREEAAARSQAVFERLKTLAVYRQARSVLVYADFQGEVATGAIIADLTERGASVFLPVMTGEGVFIPAKTGSGTIRNRFGIDEPVPVETAPKGSGKIDLVLCPGVAFDREGRRLGRGKGYYDRYLSGEKLVKIGIGYDWQLVDELPKDPHDVLMDCVVLESAVIG